MRDADGYRVVLVVMADDLVDFYERMQHFGDLCLVCGARARGRAFHFTRRVLEHRYCGRAREREKRAAHLGDPHCRLLVLREEQFFHRNTIGRMCFHQPLARTHHLLEPLCEVFFCGRLDAFRIDEHVFYAVTFHYGNPTAAVPRVNGKHFHTTSIQAKEKDRSFLVVRQKLWNALEPVVGRHGA